MIDPVYTDAITAVVAALVTFLVTKKVVSPTDIAQAYKFAVWAASAAEEMFQEGSGDTKHAYVADLLQERFGLSEEETRMLIKSAVAGLRATGIKRPQGTPVTLRPIGGGPAAA